MRRKTMECSVCSAEIELGGSFCVICKFPYSDEDFDVPSTGRDRRCADCSECGCSDCGCPDCDCPDCGCDCCDYDY